MRGKVITREEMLAIPAYEISDLSLIPPEPLVSVLVITYNHEAYIEETIQGILAQQCHFPIEIIIGEDKSPDRTLAICLDYQKKYSHLVRLVTWHENVGVNANFLRVWGRARGKYVAVCEGDDYWVDPAKLTKQVAIMEGSPETTLCGAMVRVQDASQPDLDAVFGPKQWKSQYELEDVIGLQLFQTSTYLFRASGFKIPECGHRVVCLDCVLMAAAAIQGSLKGIPDTVSVYRMHGGGIFAGLDWARRYEHWIAMFQAVLAFVDERDFPIIRKKIDSLRSLLCFELVSNGKFPRARRLAWQTVRSLAWHAPRKALVLIFHVYLPRTSRPVIDAWNRRKQRSRATSASVKNGHEVQR
jgi:glycosyltransferase involved in cell wall biosynthesis